MRLLFMPGGYHCLRDVLLHGMVSILGDGLARGGWGLESA